MKFAIAVHGTRGDVEPAIAVAFELQRRGHEVSVAVPPNLIEFAHSTGLSHVTPYGPDSHKQMESELIRKWWTLRNPVTVLRQARHLVMNGWVEMGDTLTKLATDADLIICGTTYQEVAANVAEVHSIPLASLHYFPMRCNNHLLPIRLPTPVLKMLWSFVEWVHWQLLKPAYDAQRRILNLPKSQVRAARKIVEAGTLEIQCYEKLFFPGLEEAWKGQRPFVGSMTLNMATSVDHEVSWWMSRGRAPIFFGLGSMPIEDPVKTFAMISRVCQELGERALIASGALKFEGICSDHSVMVTPNVNYAAVFPECRAIVHHGGAGTTAASLRSGIPTLVLWEVADQPVWAKQIKRLGVGTSRRFSKTTPSTLHDDLRKILLASCRARAREVAAQMTPPHLSVTMTANLLENFARDKGSSQTACSLH